MIEGLEALTREEEAFLLDVPVLITILVGDADSNLDEKEKEWAQKTAKFRAIAGDPRVLDYYRHVEKNFDQRLKEMFRHYEGVTLNAKEVIGKVSRDLEKTNDILGKINKKVAQALYDSFLSFAVHVARASGGLFNFGSISPEEREVLDLKMIKDPSKY